MTTYAFIHHGKKRHIMRPEFDPNDRSNRQGSLCGVHPTNWRYPGWAVAVDDSAIPICNRCMRIAGMVYVSVARKGTVEATEPPVPRDMPQMGIVAVSDDDSAVSGGVVTGDVAHLPECRCATGPCVGVGGSDPMHDSRGYCAAHRSRCSCGLPCDCSRLAACERRIAQDHDAAILAARDAELASLDAIERAIDNYVSGPDREYVLCYVRGRREAIAALRRPEPAEDGA